MSDHTIKATYQFLAADLNTDAVIGLILGPKGKRGRLLAWGVLCTVSLTGSTGLLEIGTAGSVTKFATLTLPNTTAIARVDGVEVEKYSGNLTRVGINPDEVVRIGCDGVATAGDGNVFITIEWY